MKYKITWINKLGKECHKTFNMKAKLKIFMRMYKDDIKVKSIDEIK